MDKLRVIMTGPMPPNVGGMATVLSDLRGSKLVRQVELVFVNTAKTTREGRSFFEGVFSKLRLWFDWFKLLRSKPKTIAHIHTCSGFTFFLDSVLVCLAKLCSVPIVLHIHGAKFDQFLDGLNPALLKAVRWIFAMCSFVVVLSDSWRTELYKRLGGHHYRVVANGVPIPDQSNQGSIQSGKVKLLFLGNLTERKGIFDLLELMRGLDNAILQLVGGEEQPGILAKVQALITSPELAEKVKYYGIKAGAEKQQLLQEADIFVLPSYAEGLPVSLLEAMAYGLPVVVSDVGGIPSAVKDGQEGFLIAAGNREQLKAVLTRLIDDPGLREKMGAAGKNRCRSEFSIDITADRLLEIYWEIFPELREILD